MSGLRLPAAALGTAPLPDPSRGGSTRLSDTDFVRLDRAFDVVRDTVNQGIDLFNELGLGLRRLPEESLRELVVLPLTGDHCSIRQNAEAVPYVDAALRVHGRNVALLGLAMEPSWGGRASAEFQARLGRQAVLAGIAGELMQVAVPLLEEVADVSERLAVEVERLVVELVERAERLLAKLLARVLGPGAWLALAAEVALKGLDVIGDMIDDARRLIEILDHLVRMKEEVGVWVEEQRRRLTELLDLAHLAASALPRNR